VINRNNAFSNQYELEIEHMPWVDRDILQYIQSSLLSATVPGFDLKFIHDAYDTDTQYHIALDDNNRQFTGSLTFLADEYLIGYSAIWNYIKALRRGALGVWEYGDPKRLKDCAISKLYLYGLDNNTNRVCLWLLRNVWFNQISNFTYSSNVSDAQRLQYTVNYTAQFCDLQMITDNWLPSRAKAMGIIGPRSGYEPWDRNKGNTNQL
jgi:hypothetical protein